MKSKKFFMLNIFSVIFLLATLSALNYIVDPMQFYHTSNYFEFGDWRDDERILNAGIIRNSDFDSILIGSSLTRNFDIAYIEKLTNWSTIKLTMSAATQKDILYTYDFANSTNKNLKNIIIGIDIVTFFQESNHQRIKFNEKFYTKKRILNLEYLLNFNTAKYSLKFLKLRILNTPKEIKKIYPLGYRYQYNSKIVLNKFKAEKKEVYLRNFYEKDFNNSNKEKIEKMIENYEKNLKIIIESSLDKEFLLFFPPKTIFYYSGIIKEDNIVEYFSFKKYLVKELSKYKNVKIYDFENVESIINNLEGYGDTIHFSPEISQEVFKLMLENRYLINRENIELELDKLKKEISNYYKQVI